MDIKVTTLLEMETVLMFVDKSLGSNTYRNDYEMKNAVEWNNVRLDVASAFAHKTLAGDKLADVKLRVAGLRARLKELAAVPMGKDLRQERFLDELKKQVIDDEEEEEVPGKKSKKKPKKSKGQRDAKKAKEDDIGMERGSSLAYKLYGLAGNPEEGVDALDDNVKHSTTVAPHRPSTPPKPVTNVLSSVTNVPFSAIPPYALETPCNISLPVNTPFARLEYTTPVSHASCNQDPVQAVVHIQMYRAVLAAVWRGPPAVHSNQAQAAPIHPQEMSYIDADDEDEAVVVVDCDDSGDDTEGTRRVWDRMASSDSYTNTKTIDEFDVVREMADELVQDFNDTPVEDDIGNGLPHALPSPVPFFRSITDAPWTVLMCHGGYFAGAVFVNRKAVIHKAFQRYVVRRKAGGKQSKCDKTGGCMSSAGSQIRRHNELKWKIIVRDILIAWSELIGQSWIILYVAPGPENRSVLTDFSNIPASAGGGSGKGVPKSPIDIKDPRVRSAPLTTHRPTFKEVTRIFETVSKCQVDYCAIAPEGSPNP